VLRHRGSAHLAPAGTGTKGVARVGLGQLEPPGQNAFLPSYWGEPYSRTAALGCHAGLLVRPAQRPGLAAGRASVAPPGAATGMAGCGLAPAAALPACSVAHSSACFQLRLASRLRHRPLRPILSAADRPTLLPLARPVGLAMLDGVQLLAMVLLWLACCVPTAASQAAGLIAGGFIAGLAASGLFAASKAPGSVLPVLGQRLAAGLLTPRSRLSDSI